MLFLHHSRQVAEVVCAQMQKSYGGQHKVFHTVMGYEIRNVANEEKPKAAVEKNLPPAPLLEDEMVQGPQCDANEGMPGPSNFLEGMPTSTKLFGDEDSGSARASAKSNVSSLTTAPKDQPLENTVMIQTEVSEDMMPYLDQVGDCYKLVAKYEKPANPEWCAPWFDVNGKKHLMMKANGIPWEVHGTWVVFTVPAGHSMMKKLKKLVKTVKSLTVE